MAATICASYTIGIVDDNQEVRDAICSFVRSHGYQALVFDCAKALLSSASLARLDCIVSDVQMPEMTGLDMLDALRRGGYAMPLVMITAFPHPALRQRALDGGASGFLSKPLLAKELLNCIAAALGIADR